MDALRRKNKEKWRKYVNELRALPLMDRVLNSRQHKLSPFTIEAINESHRIDILNMTCYQFSCTGSVVLDEILMASVTDQVSFRLAQINHAIETGLGIVAKDKYNRVVSYIFIFDYCDPVHKHSKLTRIATKRAHIMEAVTNSSMQRSTLISNGIQYGEMIDFSCGVTRPNITRSGVGIAVIIAIWSILLSMSYKYWVHEAVSAFTTSGFLQTMKRSPKWFLSHSVFDYTPFVEQEFMDLKYKYKLSEDRINYLRNHAKVHVFIDNYEGLRNENKLNDIKKWLLFVVNIWMMKKIRNKL